MASNLALVPSSAEGNIGKNSLLAALDAYDLQQLSTELEVGDYASGHILFEPHVSASFVYFPYTCVVSIINTVDGRIPCLHAGSTPSRSYSRCRNPCEGGIDHIPARQH